jgi:hypothetical protein
VIGIDPLYFWDEMSPDELKAIIKARSEKDTQDYKVSWEQARAISFYSIVAMQGTKDYKKPEDLFKFSWEKADKPKPKKLTQEEMETKAAALKQRTKKWQK